MLGRELHGREAPSEVLLQATPSRLADIERRAILAAPEHTSGYKTPTTAIMKTHQIPPRSRTLSYQSPSLFPRRIATRLGGVFQNPRYSRHFRANVAALSTSGLPSQL